MNQKNKEILARYFPPATLQQVEGFLIRHSVHFTITPARQSKLGDYRPALRSLPHRISINGNLGPWFMYLVFLHEYAHLLVWIKYQRKAAPHGPQWKQEFAALLHHALHHGIIPSHLAPLLNRFASNIRATFASATELWKELRKDHNMVNGSVTLDEIPFNAIFVASNGATFQKIEKVRTRYRCINVHNRRKYLFHAMAEVTPTSVSHHDRVV